MKIPFSDLSRPSRNIEHGIISGIKKIAGKKNFILGEEVGEFEGKWAAYNNISHAVGVASGTDALTLSLRACAITKGDEVIVPAMTFIASVLPVVYNSATPVFSDIGNDSPNSTPENIFSRVTKRTKAIIAVHLHGMPCDITVIKRKASGLGIKVIEDACQAHGAEVRVNGKEGFEWVKAGTIGDLGCFSFYPAKNLGAYGDAGAVVTDDAESAEKLRMLRNYGQIRKYEHVIKGYNSRLDTMQAVVLSRKLPFLDRWNNLRRKAAEIYRENLSGLHLALPQTDGNARENFHIFSIRTNKRDNLLAFLKDNGIDCGIHYPYPLHLTKALKELGYRKGDFPNAEKFADENLSLPMFPGITEREILYTCRMIKRFFGK